MIPVKEVMNRNVITFFVMTSLTGIIGFGAV